MIVNWMLNKTIGALGFGLLPSKVKRVLKHKHIVNYFGHELNNDSLYIYMEYLSGGNIQ